MSEAARMLLGGTLPVQPVQNAFQNRGDRSSHRSQERPERTRQKTQINDPLHTVFFYNIPYNATAEDIRTFALQYGEILNLHTVIEGKGQAFATYYDIRNAEKAVADVQDKEFNGRRISSNFAFRPPNLGKKDQLPTSANVLVKPVNYLVSLSEKEVSDALRQFGEIRSIENRGPNTFLVKYFDIRSAKNASDQTRTYKTAAGEPLDLTLFVDEEPPQSSNNNNNNNYNNMKIPQYQQQQPYIYPYGVPPPPPLPQYGYPPAAYPPYGVPAPPPPQTLPPYGMPPPRYGMPPQQTQTQPPPPPPYGMPYGYYPPPLPPPPQATQQQTISPRPTDSAQKAQSFDLLSKLVQKQIE